MEKGPHEALDAIRNQLQLILMRAELPENASHCAACAATVCDIVTEVRKLEAFVREVLNSDVQKKEVLK